MEDLLNTDNKSDAAAVHASSKQNVLNTAAEIKQLHYSDSLTNIKM